ncbi:MAG: radical SAM family heme chaperone HemW [Lentisphaerales bacterium]|jgi:oxygen-independent coproporphyrinogen-3 oxidase|nr:MAG: radical SAM family heme chaperone HemW [Lentisphaerales bacterium]
MIPSLYIHVPFCDGKCRYCAFYSVLYLDKLADRYVASVRVELDRLLTEHGPMELQTVYMGGGTPSVLSEAQVERMCAIVTSVLDGIAPIEWSVEANPGDLSEAKLRILINAGCNRISIGAQATDNAVLQRLGRRHSAADVFRAVELARRVGFDNVGIDLISCVPGVSESSWRTQIDDIVSLKPNHVSVYSLTADEGSALAADVGAGKCALSEDDGSLAMLHLARNRLADAGYRRYEISNYALPGFECRHNMMCWRGAEYLGVGPSAASFVGKVRWKTDADIESYLAACEAGNCPPAHEERLLPETRAMELIMLGLRTNEGINLSQIADVSGIATEGIKNLFVVLSDLSESGFVKCSRDRWSLTERGNDVADAVTVQLMEQCGADAVLD